jgi:XTP/dITP diphosphohydrolase
MSASRRVVLATANAGKQREFAALLAPLGFELLLQGALGIASADETGSTFEANALLKARHAARCACLPAMADDSGIEVDALNGRPGVYSARYAGPSATDDENLQLMLKELEGVDAPQRTARYRCVIAYVRDADDAHPVIASGSWEGRIANVPLGAGGFGYDPIFIPQTASLNPAQTAAQLSPGEKNTLSHRGKALHQLLAMLS